MGRDTLRIYVYLYNGSRRLCVSQVLRGLKGSYELLQLLKGYFGLQGQNIIEP
jgi:hypothetical protein